MVQLLNHQKEDDKIYVSESEFIQNVLSQLYIPGEFKGYREMGKQSVDPEKMAPCGFTL